MKTSITAADKAPKHPVLTQLTVAALWLLVWEGFSLWVGSDLLVPSPARVAGRLLALGRTPAFWTVILRSFYRISLGFFLGSVLGALLGLLSALLPCFHRLLTLPMGVIKATPVASFVILALMWISKHNLSTFIAFLMVLPLIWTNVRQGVLSADPKLLEMARVFGLSRPTVARVIYLPAVLPYFLSGCRVALGFAWKAGVAGEVIAAPQGFIGTQLYNAKIYLETADLFAWTATVVILSLLIERAVAAGLANLARRLSRGPREEARQSDSCLQKEVRQSEPSPQEEVRQPDCGPQKEARP